MVDFLFDAAHDSTCEDGNIEAVAGRPEFRIFTSFRLDLLPKGHDTISRLSDDDHPFPFAFHRDRLVASAEALGWWNVVGRLSGLPGMQLLIDAIASVLPSWDRARPAPVALKARLTVNQSCDSIEVDYTEMKITPFIVPGAGIYIPETLFLDQHSPQVCKVVLDSASTNTSVFTTHKTTVRLPYDDARERAGITNVAPDTGEVLLFNHDSEVTEASLSTPYFFRDGCWTTPPLSSGGNAGVTRRVALINRLCVEKKVLVGSLRHGEVVWISNGVRGFVKGCMHLGT